MRDITRTFEGMSCEDAERTVDALADMLQALPPADGDPVDRATRARLEGFVLGYRSHCT